MPVAVPQIASDAKIAAALTLLRAHGYDVREGACIYKIDGMFRTRREVFEMAKFPPDEPFELGIIASDPPTANIL